MDDRRFDGLTKALASGSSRRSILKGLLGIGGAVTLSQSRAPVTEAARRSQPTPKPVSCPGRQIWNGSQCACPNGLFGCGPDCCGAPEQCCDNACCPNDSICTGEEVCCPRSQVCGGDCCAPGQDCCSAGDPVCIDRTSGDCCDDTDCSGLTDSCNTGICDPSTNHCIIQPVTDGANCGNCAICQSGSCAPCESPFECCPDSICVDPANGGCCADSECTGLTDACNTGRCDPASHYCFAEPVTDGTSCGTCRTCTAGDCSQPCDSPLLCCSGTTCVDPAHGGCCADTDCPASTDPCVIRKCQTNQCVDVDAIICPQGQECSDGKCVCASGNSFCDTGATAVCCAIGEICQTITLSGGSISLCCPDGTPACVDPDLQTAVCCGGNASCHEISAGTLGSIAVCCEGEPCVNLLGVTCCPVDQVCSQLVIDTGNEGVTVGTCCEKGHAGCFDGNALYCCGEGETCTLELDTVGYGVCCATEVCLGANALPVCCADGSTCQALDRGGQTLEICCAGEPCLNGTDPTCCDPGETCQSVKIQNNTVYSCCAGEACLTANGSIDCCGEGESCKTVDAGHGMTAGVCCAKDIDACITAKGKPVCCGDEGFACQPITIPGPVTVDVCCDGPPCVGQNAVVCCSSDQICDTTLGCQNPVV